jgi:hypothetical protein
MMFWVIQPNQRLSSFVNFKVKFTEITPAEYTKATVPIPYNVYFLIAGGLLCIASAVAYIFTDCLRHIVVGIKFVFCCSWYFKSNKRRGYYS